MYYIVAVTGCEPFVDVIPDTEKCDGRAQAFETQDEAEKYAFENCAWEWRTVKF